MKGKADLKTGEELRIAKLQVVNYELRVVNQELRITRG